MRLESIVTLGPDRDVCILEARVRDMRRLLVLIQDEQADLIDLIRAHIPDLLALLGDCVRLPPGLTLDDLTLSEAELVLGAWWEMHRAFFERALAAVGLEMVTEAATSTAPVSH